jgi:hypothetical protein
MGFFDSLRFIFTFLLVVLPIVVFAATPMYFALSEDKAVDVEFRIRVVQFLALAVGVLTTLMAAVFWQGSDIAVPVKWTLFVICIAYLGGAAWFAKTRTRS